MLKPAELHIANIHNSGSNKKKAFFEHNVPSLCLSLCDSEGSLEHLHHTAL